MAYNNGFPATYQPMYPQYQMPQYQQLQGTQMSPANGTMQTMTPPMVHADIIQVASEAEAQNYPVALGASQMMVAKDDSAIYVKTAFANGQSNLDVFVKRPPAPPEKPVDMGLYVTRDEFEQRIAALSAPAKRNTKKEVDEA